MLPRSRVRLSSSRRAGARSASVGSASSAGRAARRRSLIPSGTSDARGHGSGIHYRVLGTGAARGLDSVSAPTSYRRRGLAQPHVEERCQWALLCNVKWIRWRFGTNVWKSPVLSGSAPGNSGIASESASRRALTPVLVPANRSAARTGCGIRRRTRQQHRPACNIAILWGGLGRSSRGRVQSRAVAGTAPCRGRMAGATVRCRRAMPRAPVRAASPAESDAVRALAQPGVLAVVAWHIPIMAG